MKKKEITVVLLKAQNYSLVLVNNFNGMCRRVKPGKVASEK